MNDITEKAQKQEDLLTGKIIGAAIEVHRRLGPGLLESTYETCLCFELNHVGLRVNRQIPVPIFYRDVRLDSGYRIDMIVEDEVIVEIKSVASILPVH
jgi:GxxExxY protein